jgi:hypothetical protein
VGPKGCWTLWKREKSSFPPGIEPLYNEYRGSFQGIKRPGHGVNHPPPFSAEVEERVEIFLLPFCAFIACCGGAFTLSTD